MSVRWRGAKLEVVATANTIVVSPLHAAYMPGRRTSGVVELRTRNRRKGKRRRRETDWLRRGERGGSSAVSSSSFSPLFSSSPLPFLLPLLSSPFPLSEVIRNRPMRKRRRSPLPLSSWLLLSSVVERLSSTPHLSLPFLNFTSHLPFIWILLDAISQHHHHSTTKTQKSISSQDNHFLYRVHHSST